MESAGLSWVASDEPCPHCWDDAMMLSPSGESRVYKDECMYCFNTNEVDDGIYVCLRCWQGMCSHHVALHKAKTGHCLYNRVKKTVQQRPLAEITELNQLGVEPPAEFTTVVACTTCCQTFPTDTGLCDEVAIAVNASLSPQLQDALRVDQAQNGNGGFTVECPHAATLIQAAGSDAYFSAAKPPRDGEPCSQCSHNKNNWMCITCGAIGCPRAEAGGKGHAIEHYKATGHSVVVKLGTVTPKGADLYCYACDDDVSDPKLREHLLHLGVDMMRAVKTSKSMAELQLDLSGKFDHGKISEAGKKLVLRGGSGFTGLKNFGNTCYMASVLQVLFSVPAFVDRYYFGSNAGPLGPLKHAARCTASDPADCFECQIEKLASGLLSGSFSVLVPAPPQAAPAAATSETAAVTSADATGDALAPVFAVAPPGGCTPRDFKKIIAHGHVDFSTAEQQDSAEFLRYLLETIKRKEIAAKKSDPALASLPDPSTVFEFLVEDRVQCRACRRVRYRRSKESLLSLSIPVAPPALEIGPDGKVIPPAVTPTEEEIEARRPRTTLDACLGKYLADGEIECRCESCGASTTYAQTTRLASFPDVLAIQVRREYMCPKTYTARKLDVYVDVNEGKPLDLSALRGSGFVEGEVTFNDSGSGGGGSAGASRQSAAPPVDDLALVQLLSMGIDEAPARWALGNTGNNVERAIDWVFSHPEGPPPPEPQGNAKGGVSGKSAESNLHAATDGPPTYTLFGMVSHIGGSAQSGHYIAHVLKEGHWTIFNDEKVAFSQDPPFRMASVYFYRRV